MQAELEALDAERTNLQLLVSELLLANQQLRLEITKLKHAGKPSATATHPQPRPDR
jgi:hypothetical protein